MGLLKLSTMGQTPGAAPTKNVGAVETALPSKPNPKEFLRPSMTKKPEGRGESLRRAWRLSRTGIAVVLALTAFINVLKLAIPIYIFQLLDRVIASRNIDTLIALTAIAAFALIAASIAEFNRRLMLTHWGIWIEQRFGKELFLRSLHARAARAPSRSLDDLADVSQFISASAAIAWLDVVWAPAFVMLVYLIHPVLGGIVVTGMVMILALGFANEYFTRSSRAAARKERRLSEDWLVATEQNLDTVASLSVGDHVADRWQESLASRNSELQSSRLLGLGFSEAMRLVESTQRIACYGIGVWLAIAGSLTVGGIIAGAVLGRIGTSAIRRAMSSWKQLILAARAYRRIKRRISATKSERGALRDRDAELTLKLTGTTWCHEGSSVPIFRNLNLQVAPGQILCAIGPSGSGKSSLAKVISGVWIPTSGTVTLGELRISRFTRIERQHLLGYLQQETKFLAGTLADNISSFRQADDDAIVEAAKLAKVHDIISSLQEGYETVASKSHFPLSGGEIRRIGIARALYGRPRLIVLDEPEANLDKNLLLDLISTLQRCREWGSSIVVMTQSHRFAEIADTIIALNRTPDPDVFNSWEDYRRHLGKTSSHFPSVI